MLGQIMYIFFFYQNVYYNVQTNNLQLTKINQNNMIKMSQSLKSHFDFFSLDFID